MNYTGRRWWSEPRAYVHTWPGKPSNRGTCKHTDARRNRFKARHGG